jgi:hypothetical protein
MSSSMMAECSRSLGLSQLCFRASGSWVSTKHLLLTPAQQYKVHRTEAIDNRHQHIVPCRYTIHRNA